MLGRWTLLSLQSAPPYLLHEARDLLFTLWKPVLARGWPSSSPWLPTGTMYACTPPAMQASSSKYTTSVNTNQQKSQPSQIKVKIGIFDNCCKEGGPPKATLTKKAPTIRTKKWVKKKNGMFGWISCIVPSQGEVKTPHNFKKGSNYCSDSERDQVS